MNLAKPLSFICITVLCLTGIRSTAFFVKQETGKVSYKIGADSKAVTFNSVSVSYDIEKTGPDNNLKSNSSVVFTVYDRENGLAFRFCVKDDKVIKELDGEYPLRFPSGFGDNESLRSTSIMIIDTKNGTFTRQSKKGGTCQVIQKGTMLKVNIKNATVITDSSELPFEFVLSTDKAKVKTKPASKP